MRKLLLPLTLAALTTAPLAAQTRLQFNFFEDTYNPERSSGLWYAYPDLGTYSRVSTSDGYVEIAGDARNVAYSYLTADRFRDQTLYGSDFYWSLPSLWLYCIGEGRDGFLYAEGYGGIFYKLHGPSHTYSILGTGSSGASDFASGVDGTLYGVGGNQLFRYDTETGARTLVTTLTQGVHALGISHDGRFWGIETVSYGFSHATNKLYQLDPVSGNVTFIMDLPNCEFWNYAGMASEAGPHQPINSVLLTGPGSASPGATAVFNISNAPLHSPFALLASRTLGEPFFGGQPFDLGKPLYLVSRGSTDAAGSAGTSVVVPGALSGRTVYFEAGVRASNSAPTRTYDSNVHALVVL